MRRFVTLALILVCTIPMGLSISGCKKADTFDFCNGGSSGEQEGQITNIDLEPKLQGLSLPYGAVTQISTANATDCKGNGVGVVQFTYGTTNINYADISPSGSICAGTWNRNSPGGVPNFTTCSPPPPNLLLPIPPTPAFTTPTAPTSTAGATSTLNYALLPAGINGNVDISIGGGPVLTGSITGTTSVTGFVTAFNAIPAFSTNGLVATTTTSTTTNPPTTNTVLITGPVGATNTLSFAGTTLAGYSPAAYVTASAGGATSNALPIYVHPAISSMALAAQNACFSQGTATPLVAAVTGEVNGTPTDITSLTGPLTFIPSDPTVVSINATVVPPVATAQLPGSTIISASTANATSPAGVYFTCPPKSITISAPNQVTPNTSTNFTLNLNSSQALNATVLDTNNNVITGLNLEYISTSLNTLNASSSGSVGASFPGAGTITAVCQPGECNPAPLNSVGINGDGLPITSNPVTVKTPGTVNTVLFIGSTSSQYFTDVDFSTGLVGSPVQLPYVPNSMISDKLGQTIYFGSPSELMEVSMLTDGVTKADPTVKGTVVGVSNDGTVLVMSDAVHGLIYIYFTSSGTNISFGGIATRAAFSPDDQNIYIAGQYPAPTTTNPNPTVLDNFFVYSNFDGWHPYLLNPAPTDITVTVPSVGAYLANPGATAGTSLTTARSNCPLGTPPTNFYPQADSDTAPTSRVAATFDSKHILGAYVPPPTMTGQGTATFSDLALTLPSGGGAPNNPGACPAGTGFTFTTTPTTISAGVQASSITGVLPAANSSIAFVTYTSTSTTPPALLPAYLLAPSGPGSITEVTLTGATAPVSGIFSPDGQTFYTGTAGDNLVHIISVPDVINSVTPADTGTKNPGLPLCLAQDQSGNCTSTSSGFATPNLLADRPRPTT